MKADSSARDRPRTGAGRVLRGILLFVCLATSIFFLVVFLTFFGAWKAAIAVEVFAFGAAALAWKGRTFSTWIRFVFIGTTLATTAALAILLRTTWSVQADHDARLAEMVAELCTVHLSAARVQDCEGSISNTGNGNSCRYLATATIPDATRPGAITHGLESKGFSPTELDIWGDPMEDGHRYLVKGEGVQLFLQSSWQDAEGDLRCT